MREEKAVVPCTHEMRTMHLIREQVGCTVHVKKGEEKGKRRGPSCLGVLFSYLDIYLTNSACVGLRMFFFQLEYGMCSLIH